MLLNLYNTPPQKPSKSCHASNRVGSASTRESKSDDSASRFTAVTMFTPVTHQFFKRVDPVKVSIFIKERERYELEAAKKQKELPTLTVSPYTSSIDRTLLKLMVMLGEFD